MRAMLSRWNTPALDQLRMRITAESHAFILRWVLLLTAGLSALRAVYALVVGYKAQSAWLCSLALVFAIIASRPFLKQNYRILTFLLVNLYATLEASYVWQGYTHFSQYFLYIAIYIFLTSLMSGYLVGIITAIFTTGLGLLFLPTLSLWQAFSDSNETHRVLVLEFAGHLLVAQIAVIVIVSLFHALLGKSEQEIAHRRREQAKYARRAALAESFGLMAHEINNTLAIMNGAFHLVQLNHKNKDQTARARALAQMQEAEGRLKSFVVQVDSLSKGKEEHP